MFEFYVFTVIILALAAGCLGVKMYLRLNRSMKAVVFYMLFNALATAISLFSGIWYGSNLVINKIVLLVNTAFIILIFYPCFKKQPHKSVFAVVSTLAGAVVLILTVPALWSPTSFPADAVLVYNVTVTFFCLLYYHVILLAPSSGKLRRNTRFIVLSGFFLYHAGSMMYWLVTAYAQSGGSARMTIAYFNAFLVWLFYALILFAFIQRLAEKAPKEIYR